MTLPIRFTEEALQEEAEAYLYYESQSEGLGERFLREVEEILANVSEHPTHYSFSDDTKTIRDAALKAFPFLIIYEVKADHIIVYHVHHTRKKLK